MKTNYAIAAVVPADDPTQYKVMHTCWYEVPPQQNDIDSLIEELRTDEEFGMIDMVYDKDYILYELSDVQIKEIKEAIGVEKR